MFKLNFRQEKRQILHIDADAFFASVEQVLNPKLKGKAVLVGGPTETSGIVSAASYEAKRFGVTSGMPTYLAKRKCPNAIFVSGNFEAYRDFSKRMYKIFCDYTPSTEMASIDEAYLDITGFDKPYKKPYRQIATDILMRVYKEMGLSLSCGLATNKTVAKVASSTNKPHKLTCVPYGQEQRFLEPLPLRAIPGIGPKTFALLESYGFLKVGDISGLDIDRVMELFGVRGIPIWKKCCGVDNCEVISESSLPKSISKERTFYTPPGKHGDVLRTIKELSEIVLEKLRAYDMKARTIFIKIKYRDFKSFSFQKHLGRFEATDKTLLPLFKKLLAEHLDTDAEIRLIGVGVSGLVQNYNLSLFSEDIRNERLFLAVDKLKNLHGKNLINYGA